MNRLHSSTARAQWEGLQALQLPRGGRTGYHVTAELTNIPSLIRANFSAQKCFEDKIAIGSPVFLQFYNGLIDQEYRQTTSGPSIRGFVVFKQCEPL